MTTSRPDTPLPMSSAERAKRDRRIAYRISTEDFSLVALVESISATRLRALGPLVNISGGGCCLVVSTEVARRWTPGESCAVHLPVTERGLRYPAVLVAVEPWGESGHDMLLRLRFRKTDAATQQTLTRWISQLALQSWHR